MMHQYRELKVWKLAMAFCQDVYNSISDFPMDEKYGLTSQIKRCAISIPSNIAEGAGRNSNRDFQRFLNIAAGSSCELSTQLELSKNLGLLKFDVWTTLEKDLISIQNMLYRLNESLKE